MMRSHSQSPTSQFRHLAALARAHPRRYRWRVTALAAVGYAYILLLGLAFATAGGGILAALLYGIWTKHPAMPADNEGIMAVLAVSLIFSAAFLRVATLIFRAFWMTLPQPKGVKLRPFLAPKLFVLLQEIGRPLGIGKLQHVTVTTNFEIRIHRQPRLGGLLPPADTLVIGLPILQALSMAQLRLLLLQQLSGLACQRRQVGSPWVGWQGLVWQNLAPVNFLFEGMLRWYKPLFNRHLRVLARQAEHDADAIAAHITDPTLLGHVLVLTTLLQRYHKICYQKLLKQAEQHPHPPTDGLSQWLTDTQTPPPQEVQERWWHEMMSADDTDSPYPSLPSRLTQLGADSLFWQPFQFSYVTERAADQLLGPYHHQLTQELNRLWHIDIATDWSNRYDYVQTVNSIKCKANKAPLTIDEIWQFAEWHVNENDTHQGYQLLEQCLRLEPLHGPANFTLGKLLLTAGNTQGVPYMEQAMSLGVQWIDPACRLLIEFFATQNDIEQAKAYTTRLKQHHHQLQQAHQERTQLHGRPFCSCPLSVQARQQIRQQLTRFKEIETAYLVKKQVHVFPESPCYMLVVVRVSHWYSLNSRSIDQQLHQRLKTALELPENTVLLVVPKQQAKGIATVENSLLYSRSSSLHN